MAQRKAKSCMSRYASRKNDASSITFEDFANPYTFFNLLGATNEIFVDWLQNHKLIATEYACQVDNCVGICTRKQRNGKSEGFTLRCNVDRNHEYSIKTNSIFSGTKVPIRDLMVFFRSHMNKLSMRLSASEAGIDYKHTAGDWSKILRCLFMEYVYVHVINAPLKFSGTVEIDESLFGRKVKSHRGNPHTGIKIWILGMVERDTNRIILYPVEDRKTETLKVLIERHVKPGSRIFTDGWRGYGFLEESGYDHFVVNHTTTFKQSYHNTVTGEVVQCHTNQIEGAWAHAKKHFR